MKKRKRSGPTTMRLSKREVLLIRWDRFNWERTTNTARVQLYEGHNNVSCTIPGPYNHTQVVSAICGQSQLPINIHQLSPQLETLVAPRGTTVFGSAWDAINKIAWNYTNMYWWVSEQGLTMDLIAPTPAVDDFDKIAGKLVQDMHTMYKGKRSLARQQHLEIAAQLDQLGIWKPLHVVPQTFRVELVKFNQKHSNNPTDTFAKAIATDKPEHVRRHVLRRLSRAHCTYKQQEGI